MYPVVSFIIILIGAAIASYAYFSHEDKFKKNSYGFESRIGMSRFDKMGLIFTATLASALAWPIVIPAGIAAFVGYKLATRKKNDKK